MVWRAGVNYIGLISRAIDKDVKNARMAAQPEEEAE